MAWCKTNISDFFGWNFFFFKSAWILACAFQFSRKTFPCICLPILHLVSEENKDKISRHAQWTQQGGTRENILFGSFVSMCWCGASDQSAKKGKLQKGEKCSERTSVGTLNQRSFYPLRDHLQGLNALLNKKCHGNTCFELVLEPLRQIIIHWGIEEINNENVLLIELINWFNWLYYFLLFAVPL